MTTTLKTFKLDTKNIFITIPQTQVSKEQAYNKIIDEYKNKIDYFIVSHEKHQDEGDHLHILLTFKNRFQTKQKNIFDFIADKHPNIQSARNRRDVLKYIVKDGDYLAYNINVDAYLKEDEEHSQIKSKGRFKELAEKINKDIKDNKLNIKELYDEFNELFIKYSKQIHEYINKVKQLENEDEVKDYYDNQFKNIKWNKFQEHILEIVNSKIDNRKIHWIYDKKGGYGKSTIANYLEIYKDAYIITGGKQADIYRHFNNNKIVAFDLPRDYTELNESIYSVMECLKNGYFIDGKYEGQKKRFIPPHIIVFSNSMPNMEKLSKDRYNIINVEEYNNDNIINDISLNINNDIIEDNNKDNNEIYIDNNEIYIDNNKIKKIKSAKKILVNSGDDIQTLQEYEIQMREDIKNNKIEAYIERCKKLLPVQ